MRNSEQLNVYMPADEKIARVVIDLLKECGYDGFTMKDVALNAHVSLSTVYKHFSTREELIAKAVSCWAEEHVFPQLSSWKPQFIPEFLNGLLLIVLGPLEKNPWMAEVYHRAFTGRAGRILEIQYFSKIKSIAAPCFDDLDPVYAEDISFILGSTWDTLMLDVARERRSIAEVLTLLQRTVYRLTCNNEEYLTDKKAPSVVHLKVTES